MRLRVCRDLVDGTLECQETPHHTTPQTAHHCLVMHPWRTESKAKRSKANTRRCATHCSMTVDIGPGQLDTITAE